MKQYLARLVMYLMCVGLILPLTNDYVLAADSEVTFLAQYRQDVPVEVSLAAASEISSLDPGIASDDVSLDPIENLFLRLADLDPVTNEVRPELARDWEVSDDGRVWTFHLRDDVNWMQYVPATGNAETIRPVIADDFVYGIKRACDPRLGGYYSAVIASVIEGCDEVNETAVEQVTDELVFGDTIEIVAIDDTTLEIRLQFAANYFLSITTLAVMSPLPEEILDAFGDDWTAAGNIVTNGPFFLEENVRWVRRVFVRNEALPRDLVGQGNLDRVQYTVIEDAGVEFGLYQDHQLDRSRIPAAELSAVLDDEEFADQIYSLTTPTVYFFAYTHDKAPFDDVHVRRAFNAILDRKAFVEQIRQRRGQPMIHFTPPGVAYAPPIDEIGVGFDPDYAWEELALAGYPDCEGFPNVDIVTYVGAGTWAEFWAAMAEEYLGCDPALFNIDQLEFSFIEPVDPDTPVQDRPSVWTAGWEGDYPDADGWIRGTLHCEVSLQVTGSYSYTTSLMQICDETDLLIEAAAQESDPERRAELYLELEERLFGIQGEVPVVPIFVRVDYAVFKPWYSGPFGTDGIFGGGHWETWSIDMAAKLAEQDQ